MFKFVKNQQGTDNSKLNYTGSSAINNKVKSILFNDFADKGYTVHQIADITKYITSYLHFTPLSTRKEYINWISRAIPYALVKNKNISIEGDVEIDKQNENMNEAEKVSDMSQTKSISEIETQYKTYLKAFSETLFFDMNRYTVAKESEYGIVGVSDRAVYSAATKYKNAAAVRLLHCLIAHVFNKHNNVFGDFSKFPLMENIRLKTGKNYTNQTIMLTDSSSGSNGAGYDYSSLYKCFDYNCQRNKNITEDYETVIYNLLLLFSQVREYNIFNLYEYNESVNIAKANGEPIPRNIITEADVERNIKRLVELRVLDLKFFDANYVNKTISFKDWLEKTQRDAKILREKGNGNTKNKIKSFEDINSEDWFTSGVEISDLSALTNNSITNIEVVIPETIEDTRRFAIDYTDDFKIYKYDYIESFIGDAETRDIIKSLVGNRDRWKLSSYNAFRKNDELEEIIEGYNSDGLAFESININELDIEYKIRTYLLNEINVRKGINTKNNTELDGTKDIRKTNILKNIINKPMILDENILDTRGIEKMMHELGLDVTCKTKKIIDNYVKSWCDAKINGSPKKQLIKTKGIKTILEEEPESKSNSNGIVSNKYKEVKINMFIHDLLFGDGHIEGLIQDKLYCTIKENNYLILSFTKPVLINISDLKNPSKPVKYEYHITKDYNLIGRDSIVINPALTVSGEDVIFDIESIRENPMRIISI